MDYAHEILSVLLDRYERRIGQLSQEGKPRRSVTLDIPKQYPVYRDHLCAEERAIDDAVTRLASWQMVTAPRSPQGYYTKVTLKLDCIPEIYEFLERKPAHKTRQEQLDLLLAFWQRNPDNLSGRFAGEMIAALQVGRSPRYGLQGNLEKLRDVLLALEKIGQLNKETYIRNFSEAVFHDSKRFRSIAGTMRTILSDLTDQPVGKKKILEYYNLLENPTYLYLKGGWILEFPDSCVRLADFPGGIGLTSDGLSAIRSVRLESQTVVTVENLTTYHDIDSEDRAVLYLGGVPKFSTGEFSSYGLRFQTGCYVSALWRFGSLWFFNFRKSETKNWDSIYPHRNGSCFAASLLPGWTLPLADQRRSESYAVTYALRLPGNICFHAGT